MSCPAIRIEKLGKRYLVSGAAHRRPRYQTLRESLSEMAMAPWRRARGEGAGRLEEFWALKDVSFEVQPGEVVGIIGRNGAGKSTLLKVLSRITRPTTGQVRLHGRAASLLEVGTGFHPELSGRENIYLNGSILGMQRSEIERKFDEIVEFSGVERFLDTPVKRYSSGMYVRLAFAVAAHLDPEIMVVDEVLAVGDSEFQKKCLGKMSEVAKDGRTVLFVSHNLAAVQNLCKTGVLLSAGRVVEHGKCRDVVGTYLRQTTGSGSIEDLALGQREAHLVPVIQRIDLLDEAGQSTDTVRSGDALTIRITYDSPVPLLMPRFGVVFETHFGERLFFLQTHFQLDSLPELPPAGCLTCTLPEVPLRPGTYYLSPGCSLPDRQIDFLERAVVLRVESGDFFGTGRLPLAADKGHVLVRANWQTPADAASHAQEDQS